MVRMQTGWKPILLYAVASPRIHSHHLPMIFSRSQIAYKAQVSPSALIARNIQTGRAPAQSRRSIRINSSLSSTSTQDVPSARGLKSPSGLGYGVGLTRESGPWRSGKLLVFSTWTPALCSPLNGVTTLGLPPAFSASFGELNHRPKW
jgi:hypothetical protein